MIAPQSAHSVPAAPLRWGIWLIPVAGIIPAIVFTLWMVGPNPNIDTDPKGAADAATGALGLGGGIVYLLATIALVFGLFALYAWLAGGRMGTAALAGLLVGSAPIVSQLGGILLLIGGVWIARTLGQGGAPRSRSAPTVSPI